jgi:hypothetical protein
MEIGLDTVGLNGAITVAFLAPTRARYIHGDALHVGGGYAAS